MSALTFEILSNSSHTNARLGRVTTPHGSFDTPAFMPVGTRASIKGVVPRLVAETGSQIILALPLLLLFEGSLLLMRFQERVSGTSDHGEEDEDGEMSDDPASDEGALTGE